MGKKSRRGESQISNLDKCVNVEGFSSAGSLGQWVMSLFWDMLHSRPQRTPRCRLLKGEFWTEGPGKCLHHQRSLLESQSTIGL